MVRRDRRARGPDRGAGRSIVLPTGLAGLHRPGRPAGRRPPSVPRLVRQGIPGGRALPGLTGRPAGGGHLGMAPRAQGEAGFGRRNIATTAFAPPWRALCRTNRTRTAYPACFSRTTGGRPWRPFDTLAGYVEWAEEICTRRDLFFHAIIDQVDGQGGRCCKLSSGRAAERLIEVGHINYSPLLQRTPRQPRRCFS